MKRHSKTSGFWKLTPVVAVAAAIAILLAGVAMVLYAESSYRAQKINEATAQAHILASTVTAALFFEDRRAAQEYVSAMTADPEVRAAALYDAKGLQVASYARRPDEAAPQMVVSSAPRIEDDHLVIVAPVMQDGARIGAVYLQTGVEPIARRLALYGPIAMLVTMVSLFIAVLGLAQRALAKANQELEDRAGALALANESLETQIKEREKAEQALRQAQKMEAIGQLTGGVAHDFNNLLTVVLGNLELIRRSLGNAARVEKLADGAIEAVERGARLIKQLLMFARRQILHPENIDPNQLIANFETLITRATGVNVELITKLSSTLDPVRIDSTQFESAILNLVVNAREAVSGQGRIVIETKRVELESRDLIDNPGLVPGSYVLVAVGDNGCGISPEMLSRVFDPFVTTKEVGKGSGLGLSQVYGFAKESGGFVEIQSTVDVGTTVMLYLPRSTDEVLAVDVKAPLEQPARSLGVETILVVEDERIVLDTVVESLKQLGYRVLTAENAAAALDILQSSEAIDVMFSDVVMPGEINGAQLAAAATRLRPKVKVLLTSGYAASALAAEHGLKGNIPLLQKPYRAHELVAQLHLLTNAA